MTGLLLAKTGALLFVLLGVLAPAAAWIERRQSAYAQDRLAPSHTRVMTASFGGLLQPMAEALRLLGKESVVPRGADRVLHAVGPMLAVVPVIAVAALIPFGGRYALDDSPLSLVLADVDWGLLLVLALFALSGLGYVLAGWSSNSDRALIGSVREGAQTLSCQIALSISLMPMVALYGTLRLTDMALLQDRVIGLSGPAAWLGIAPLPTWANGLGLPAWGIGLNPVAFASVLLCAMVATRRPPFGASLAGTELGGGYGVEHTGAAQGLFVLARAVGLVVVAGLVTVVFLGGGSVPWLSQTQIVDGVARFLGEGFANLVCLGVHVGVFLAKLGAVVALQVALGGAMPRLRDDQLMDWLWKGIVPLAVVNVVVTGFVVVGLSRGMQ